MDQAKRLSYTWKKTLLINTWFMIPDQCSVYSTAARSTNSRTASVQISTRSPSNCENMAHLLILPQSCCDLNPTICFKIIWFNIYWVLTRRQTPVSMFNLLYSYENRYYYYPHFPGEKTEAQRGKVTCEGHRARRLQILLYALRLTGPGKHALYHRTMQTPHTVNAQKMQLVLGSGNY